MTHPNLPPAWQACVDLGGTKVAVTLARAGKLLLETRLSDPTAKEGERDAVARQILRLIDAAAVQAGVAPADIAEELAIVAAEDVDALNGGHSHRLISRRMRHLSNSVGLDMASIRERSPFNPAYMNPDELSALGVADGDRIIISSDTATIPAVVAADPTVRCGVVSMTHGWGSLPDETDYDRHGSNTGLLISTDRDLDPINAMPRMSAIPVNVSRAN